MNRQLLGEPWYEVLKEELEKDYFQKLREVLKEEYTTWRCYPNPQDIFKVFQLCPPDKVRVVMLSQD
jgi:uracil-DNA glycosylase